MNTIYQPAIHFHNVCFEVGEQRILQQVTGSFPTGNITTLVGPSGAGKTTLLKLCNGLISPTSGEIFIHNKPINSINPIALRRHVGIALQSAPMIKGTVYTNLSLPKTLQGMSLSREEAISFLGDVGLDPSFLEQNVTELSGGQRQRVSIARTLVNKSDILLLDEITSALDRTSVKEVEELIVNINQKYNVTIIWITHNLEQAIKIGHYTWVMMNGHVVETGKSTLLNHPTKDVVQQFVEGCLE
ncbi:ATP-binding cassette domain-containing protein [Rummeliibacillus sp. SL167]|uniref:ABC transporter ATP-binding protein n=1 Tax=Rummeliibacillus sp. SL167 TaxID=2579792 RepID=UPI0011B395DA|nr:phosphate ABC transporter ATP-binding protein [Rummeliibacillus sp. SL167]